MLVLSRKVNEAIVIGGTVRVVVAAARGAVRLGVQAPPEVTIDREEVHRRKEGATRGPPEVFTQQEFDVLADQLGCVSEVFCGRQMYVREAPALAPG